MRNRSGKKAGQATEPRNPHIHDVEEAHEYGEHFETMQFAAEKGDLKIDEEELQKKLKYLSIPIPKRTSDLSKLPDKCFADMSFIFTVLVETPSDNGGTEDMDKSLPIRRVLKKKPKSGGAVPYEEIFVTDLKIDGTEVYNAVIDPSFPHTVMSSNFFYNKFGGTDGNQGLFFKPSENDKSKKFVNGYKSRGVRTLEFKWDGGRIKSLCSVIQDSPSPLILGRAIHPFFSSQKILEAEFDNQKFSLARSATPFGETLHMTQLGLLKSILQMSTSFKSPSIDHNLEVRQMFPAIIAALERWTAEKKRSILQAKLKGASRDSKEAMNGDHSKGIKTLFEFLLNALRAWYFLPKGRNYRRLRCICNQDGQQLSSMVIAAERNNPRNDSEVLKRKYLRKFVLEKTIEDRPHLHSCSNVRCTRKEPTPGAFKVCGRCWNERTLVRHFYCSRACQLEEWSWSHGTFHSLVMPPHVDGTETEEIQPYPMMVKQNGKFEEITCDIAPGARQV